MLDAVADELFILITANPIPDDVRRFVLCTIPSVPYLEALLLMRSTPQAAWDAARIARRLYLNERAAADLLVALSAAGIAARGADGFRYLPQDTHLARSIDSLAAAYSRHLVEITLLIHTKNEGKPQHFANAFLFRRKR